MRYAFGRKHTSQFYEVMFLFVVKQLVASKGINCNQGSGMPSSQRQTFPMHPSVRLE